MYLDKKNEKRISIMICQYRLSQIFNLRSVAINNAG